MSAVDRKGDLETRPCQRATRMPFCAPRVGLLGMTKQLRGPRVLAPRGWMLQRYTEQFFVGIVRMDAVPKP